MNLSCQRSRKLPERLLPSPSRQMDVTQWVDALQRLTRADDTFLTIHSDFEPEVLHRLKFSYDALHDGLKPCFLLCALFPEDASIDVEYLVRLWAGELRLTSGDTPNGDSIETTRIFLNILIDRCLVEASVNLWSERVDYCRIHDLFRYLAIHIAEKEERCLFRAGRNLEIFPLEEAVSCTRMSLMSNRICYPPRGFICPTLITLVLRGNRSLREVPCDFFESLTGLKVLDLSDTNIESLPLSIGRLKSLVYLQLSETEIRSLPGTICQLKCSKYLNLHDCRQLKYVPPAISRVSSLESLDVLGCNALVVKKGAGSWGTASLNDLTKLQLLVEARLRVGPGIPFWVLLKSWRFLRRVTLDFTVKSEKLPAYGASIPFRNLESIVLQNSKMAVPPASLNNLCNVTRLTLNKCLKLNTLRGLSRPSLGELEIKECENITTLVMEGWGEWENLKMLSLERLHNLESMVANGLEAFPRLKKLRVWRCGRLKKLPLGLHRTLEVLVGDENWWNGIVWENGEDWDSMRRHLQSIYINSSTFTLQDFSVE